MKKQLLYLATSLLFSLPLQAQEKERIYSLREGEKLLMEESALRTSATANSFMILVERENIAAAEGGTTYHIITDKETYGPYGGMISDFYSGDMKRRATVLPDIKNDPEKGIEKNFVLFDDGKMMGPYNGFPSVSFSYDGSDWAIVVAKYDEATSTQSTTIRFRVGAKDLFVKGSEYVEFAPKGNTSVRVASKETPEGNYQISLNFSDGKKLGPWVLNNHQFSADGKSYITLREEKDGTRVLAVNDIETRFPAAENVGSYVMTDDASDWVILGYQDDRAKLIFKNGEQTELYERVVESSVVYDKASKQWMYMTASKEKMSIDLHLGNKIIHSFPFTDAELVSNTDEPYFFVGGLIEFSKDNKQALIQYNVNESLSKYALYKQVVGAGEAPIKEYTNKEMVFTGFDGRNRPYFVKEKPGKTEDDEHIYSMEGSINATKFRHYPDELNFIENSDNWYVIYYGDNALQLSDGSYFDNAFDVKYDKATKKLTWLSLEGRDLYVNRKSF